VLVETFLPGREFTVGLIGTGADAECVGVMEVHLLPKAEAEVYSFANKEQWRDCVRYTLADGPIADEAAALALAAWRGLGCRDGGRIDVRADGSGRPGFLEVNVLPGLNPETGDLPILARLGGMEFPELMRRIVESACRRTPALAGETKPVRRKADRITETKPALRRPVRAARTVKARAAKARR
jgi:D-alanine-D-alanine ligase